MKGLVIVGLLMFGWAMSDGGQGSAPSTAADSSIARVLGDVSRDDDVAVTEAIQKTQPPAARTYVVSRIVDGDTLELGNGATVRLAGIDTPEVGVCGYPQASINLSRLVLGKRVRLGHTDEDHDQYGRLLRYVNVGDMDAGLRLIKNGLAVARYDSRDGYGYHPREPRYIAADRASRNFTCSNTPQPAPAPGGCAPGYTPCIAPYPPDLDCADVNGPLHVTGTDPPGLDADGDGSACE